VLLVIIVAVVALFVMIGVLSAVQIKRQRAALQDWAATRGWTYIPRGGGPWLQHLPQGNAGRGVRHQVDGLKGDHPVTVADYHYTTATTDSDPRGGSRTTTTSRSLTVVVVGLMSGHPSVELRARVPGKLGIGVAKAVGLPMKNLTGVEEFDRRYRIHAHSEAAAALVSPQVIQATLSRDLPAWQVRGDQLIIPWPGRMKAEYLDNRVGCAIALAALLDFADIPA
jgi:hypothetical protein